MDSWDEATEPGGDFLKGSELPTTGTRATLVSIEIKQMKKFESEEQETCFIGTFKGTEKVVKFNQTARIYLKDSCGITQENIGGFLPIELVLYPQVYNLGTAVAVRLPDAPQPAETPVSDDVPF